jgi:hypothetical protein
METSVEMNNVDISRQFLFRALINTYYFAWKLPLHPSVQCFKRHLLDPNLSWWHTHFKEVATRVYRRRNLVLRLSGHKIVFFVEIRISANVSPCTLSQVWLSATRKLRKSISECIPLDYRLPINRCSWDLSLTAMNWVHHKSNTA